ncbi:MAG: T9SS type A sorting domain-containing protein [Ignavibacteria bacterium]|nr:T9SS type A sorting domain-containing protein [Ignavibacteria bacterium]
MTQHPFRFAFVCTLVLAAAMRTSAQQPFWEKVSTAMYCEWSVAFGAPGTLYLSDGYTGVLRSTDDGTRWEPKNSGLERRAVFALLTAPNGTLFAGTDRGMYRSLDGAQTWEPASSGMPDQAVYSITNGPGNTLLAAQPYGLYRSDDLGNSWSEITLPISSGMYRVAVLPSGTFVVTAGTAIFFSSDQGQSWRISIPASSWTSPVCETANGTFVVTSGGALYTSTDRGSTWSGRRFSLLGEISALVTGSDGSLFAFTWGLGVVRTTDLGDTWSQISRSTHPDVKYATLFQFDPQDRLLIAGRQSGVFRIPPDSSAWEQLRGSYPLNRGNFLGTGSLAVGRNGAIVLFGDENNFEGDLWISGDDGNTWTSPIRLPAIDLGSTRSLTAGVLEHFYMTTQDSLYSSNDDARTWTAASSPGRTLRAVQQTATGALIAGTEDGIFKSNDEGRTWRNTSRSTGNRAVFSIAQDPHGILYALTGSGTMIASNDEGESWAHRASTGLQVLGSGFGNTIALACGANGRVYAANRTSKDVYVSNDGASTFQAVKVGGIGYYVQIAALAVDRKGRVYAGFADFRGKGVAVSDNFGLDWQPENSGFRSTEYGLRFEPVVYDFAVGNDGRVWALTDSGLFRSSDWTLGTDSPPVSRFDIGHNYPNPFHSATAIAFTLQRRGHADVRVYDALGRQVALLADGVFDAGTTRLAFNGSGLPGGVYFCRISTAGGVETLRMMLTPSGGMVKSER